MNETPAPLLEQDPAREAGHPGQHQWLYLGLLALVGALLHPLLTGAFGGNATKRELCGLDEASGCTTCGVSSLLAQAENPRRESTLALADESKPAAAEAKDLLIADFEGETYGDWKVTGEALGPGPARGTLPNQMPVSGFEGKGLVNTYYNGDGTTGTLTSPEFKIERPYINFLIGGGKHPGETAINLLVKGKIVRTASGPNDKSGGSEQLDWRTWDVREFQGRAAVIEIVDRHTGGWGHINIDQIGQSTRRLQAEPARRELALSKPFLHIPVKTGASQRRIRIAVDGKTVREFEVELADKDPDFRAFCDLSAFVGRQAAIECEALPSGSKMLEAITLADFPVDGAELYREKHRPQLHFTSRRGWLNDPNGMVYFDGEYHLYYQHNPFGWNWGNMHWGHAVSRDLVHWKELPIALYPQGFGDWAFSGSAVVDTENTSRFQTDRSGPPPLVLAYTSTGRGECIAYSTDRGRTWTEYSGNPVVRHAGRDPRLLWHAPTKRWVMAVYDEHAGKQWIAIYTSPDLKAWQFASRIDGFYECPDLFELPVQGSGLTTKWVLYGADGKYLLGQFDGRVFTPDSRDKQQLWFGNFYAAQTFSNTPDGRRIQIGWGNGIAFPGMPFNQQMTVACELTLRADDAGVQMFAQPVSELSTLRDQREALGPTTIEPATPLQPKLAGDLLDVQLAAEAQGNTALELSVRGVPVVYDFGKQELTCRQVTAPLKSQNGKVTLRVVADRGSLEVFANAGRVAVSVGVLLEDSQRRVELGARGGPVRVESLRVETLKSSWQP